MISHQYLVVFLLLILQSSHVYSLTAPVFNGYQIVDLSGTSSSTLDIEAASWTLVGVSTTSSVTNCSSVPLLGGVGILNPNGYMKRTYKSLPTHDIIYFRLRFYIIDNWQSTDTFVIQFDSKNVSGGTPGSQKSGFWSNYCGSSSYNDLKYYTLNGKVLHSGSSLDLRVISGLSSLPSIASFGMREVSLQFVNKTSSDAESVCSDVSDSGANMISMSNACSCSGAQYQISILNFIPVCTSCNTACSSCFGSSASQCYSCKPTYSLINGACTKCSTNCNTCNGTAANQCLTCSSGYWIRWDNTCVSTCDSPTYAQTVIGDLQICGVPCPSSQFWLWNQTCNDCPSPLVQGVTNFGKYCYKPCDSGLYYAIWNSSCVSSCNTPFLKLNIYGIDGCRLPCDDGRFLYPDGSCSLSCPSPYKQRYDGLIWWCDYPCNFANGESLSWDGICVNPCSLPSYQRTDGNIIYCDACQPNYFRYPNNTCRGNCVSPRSQREVNNSYFCDDPCNFASGQSLSWTGVCVSSCLSPSYKRTEDNIVYCDACQVSGDYRYPNNTCNAGCISPRFKRTVNNSKFCDNPCNFANGESLSWNGLCVSSCLSPSYQRTEDNIMYCDACQSGYYRYPNGSCRADCDSPWLQSTVNNSNFCGYPCNFASGESWSWTEACVSSCLSPSYQYTQDNIVYCEVCQPGYFKYPNGSCELGCTTPWFQRKVDNTNSYFCDFPCDFSHGESLSWDGTCVSSCSSPSYQRTQDSLVYCDDCQLSADFRYPNNTCQSDCSLPWKQSSINSSQFCTYPCQTSEFGYWNGSCFDSCDSPYQQEIDDSFQYCYPPCSSSQFFYWDNSCQDSCDSPLKSTITNEYKLCDLPCDDSNNFLYQDNSCQSACDDPYLQSTNNSAKLCNKPCLENQYLFSDNTCQDSCPSPQLQSKTNNVDTCIQPCSNGDYYYSNNKTCRSNCDSPSTKSTNNSVKVCTVNNKTDSDGLSDDEKDQVKNTNDAAQAGGAMAGVGASIASLASSANPSSALLICFIKMLQYIKYIDVDYPPKLLYMFKLQNDTMISFTYLPSSKLDPFEKSLHEKPLPGKFAVYGNLSSYFLVNFWDSFFLLFIVILIIIAIIVFHFYLKKKGHHFKDYLEQLLIVFKWNIMLIVLCSSFADIALYSSLEFHKVQIHSFSTWLSMFSCIMMNLLFGYIMYKIIYVVRDLRKNKRKVFASNSSVSKYLVEVHRKWEYCQVFYKAFKDDSFLQQIFLFISMLRVYLFNIVLGLLYRYPIAQATIILTFSLLILVLVAKLKPFQNKIDQIQLVINELILLTVNICVFILAIFDHLGKKNTTMRRQLGDTIIICTLMFNFIAIFFFALQFMLALHRMYKLYKTKQPKTLKAWVKPVLQILQQDAMVTDDKFTKNEEILTTAEAFKGNFLNLFNTTQLNQQADETSSSPIKSMLSPSNMNLLNVEDISGYADNRSMTPTNLFRQSVATAAHALNLVPSSNPTPDKLVAEQLKSGHCHTFRASPQENNEEVPSLNVLKLSSGGDKQNSDDSNSANNNNGVDSPLAIVIPPRTGVITPQDKGRKSYSTFRRLISNSTEKDLDDSLNGSTHLLQPKIEERKKTRRESLFCLNMRKSLLLKTTPSRDIDEVNLSEQGILESEGSEMSPNLDKDRICLTIEGNEEDEEDTGLEKEKIAELFEFQKKGSSNGSMGENQNHDYIEVALKKRERIMARIKIRESPTKMDFDVEMNVDGGQSNKN